MSNSIKESLRNNLEHILNAVPADLHEAVKTDIESLPLTHLLTVEEAKKQAIELIKENTGIPITNDAECEQLIEDPASFADKLKTVEPESIEKVKELAIELLKEHEIVLESNDEKYRSYVDNDEGFTSHLSKKHHCQ